MASTYLSRTLGTSTNTYKGTVSVWLKRSGLSSDQVIYGNYTSGTQRGKLVIAGDGKLMYYQNDSGTNTIKLETNRLFRDVGSWYHIVLSVDTTQSTASNRVKLYVNGTQETSFATATYPSQNLIFYLNANSVLNYIGQEGNSSDYWDGLMSYFSVVDGTAYDASYFGETNAATGIWTIKTSPSVTYGTNGFFLKMDTSSPGSDTSGNNNTFTASGTPTLAQDNASNNFPTLNPLVPGAKTPIYGNLHIEALYASWKCNTATFGLAKGKWYYEFKLNQLTNYAQVGIVSEYGMELANDFWGSQPKGYTYNSGNGQYYNNNSGNSYGNSYTASNYMACAMDLDNNKLYFAKDNVWQNSGDPTSGSTGTGAISISQQAGYDFWLPAFSINYCGVDANFGNGYFGTSVAGTNQDANGIGKFKYTPPSGYFSINTKNLNTYGG